MLLIPGQIPEFPKLVSIVAELDKEIGLVKPDGPIVSNLKAFGHCREFVEPLIYEVYPELKKIHVRAAEFSRECGLAAISHGIPLTNPLASSDGLLQWFKSEALDISLIHNEVWVKTDEIRPQVVEYLTDRGLMDKTLLGEAADEIYKTPDEETRHTILMTKTPYGHVVKGFLDLHLSVYDLRSGMQKDMMETAYASLGIRPPEAGRC